MKIPDIQLPNLWAKCRELFGLPAHQRGQITAGQAALGVVFVGIGVFGLSTDAVLGARWLDWIGDSAMVLTGVILVGNTSTFGLFYRAEAAQQEHREWLWDQLQQAQQVIARQREELSEARRADVAVAVAGTSAVRGADDRPRPVGGDAADGRDDVEGED